MRTQENTGTTLRYEKRTMDITKPSPERSSETVHKILVVEDEPDLLMGLKENLEYEGYKVVTAADGLEAISAVQRENPDLIVLDLMLPKLDGYEVCRRLRNRQLNVPIIILTAKGQEADKVRGLDLGADDYITKPFSLREFLARIKAVLRRREPAAAKLETYRVGSLEVDFTRSVAQRGKRTIELSHYELEILRLLILNKEQPVSRERLLNEVWGYRALPATRTVDNHIVRLRQKLEENPGEPRHIITVHGMGYKFLD